MNGLVTHTVNKSENRLHEFESLAMPLMDRVYNTALQLTKNPYDAEDLVQDTFLKAYRSFHRFEPNSNFYGWIFRILLNNYINIYRSKKRRPKRIDFDLTCAIYHNDDSSEDIEDKDLLDHYENYFNDPITRALNKLPESYRIVLLLSDVIELKYKEIAEILDCPIGTVMSRLFRARQILARVLKSYARHYGYATTTV